MKKYELVKDDTIHFVIKDENVTNSHKLNRIRALVDIPMHGVKAGDFGGYIEKEENLSHEGNSWVAPEAKVLSNAKVSGNALITGTSEIKDFAQVMDDAVVDSSEVADQATIKLW